MIFKAFYVILYLINYFYKRDKKYEKRYRNSGAASRYKAKWFVKAKINPLRRHPDQSAKYKISKTISKQKYI